MRSEERRVGKEGRTGGVGGSQTKAGTGNVGVANANTYTGAINITAGKLRDENETFFFQAEDGIRVTSVTGVQTCALPISGTRPIELLKIAPGGSQLFARRSLAQVRGHRGEDEIGRASCRERGKNWGRGGFADKGWDGQRWGGQC